MDTVVIKSAVHDYFIHYVDHLDFLHGFKETSQYCYVVDEKIWAYYADTVLAHVSEPEVFILRVSEEKKTLETVQELYDFIIPHSAKRNLTVISLGGGILQDISGFAASTLYRGVNWIFVPTTLLAQADSCIGSKTSLNYRHFKNLIGSFYPPSEIFVYVPFVLSLDDLDFYSGLGEVVKLHILGGAEKIEEMIHLLYPAQQRSVSALRTCVERSISVKLSYITKDEYDKGVRSALNYGHCVGHALEATSDFAIPHGQAVLLGMLVANNVAQHRGLLSENLNHYLADQLILPCLRVAAREKYFDHEVIVEAMKKDKKRVGNDLALVMLCDGYRIILATDLKPYEVYVALDELLASGALTRT